MKFFLIVLTILFNLNGYAAQLGKITVKSTQDSLFDAEIILTLDKEDDIKKNDSFNSLERDLFFTRDAKAKNTFRY
jgi:hypothetical protein